MQTPTCAGVWNSHVAVKTVMFQDNGQRPQAATPQHIIAEASIAYNLHGNVVTTYAHEIKPLAAGRTRWAEPGSSTWFQEVLRWGGTVNLLEDEGHLKKREEREAWGV
jgi:hypothetical protein